MGRGPPELGCPQSQGFVDVQQEEHLSIAKRSFRRVHRDHADAPLPPLATCTGLANELTRSVSSRHSPRDKRCDFTNGKNCSSRVKVTQTLFRNSYDFTVFFCEHLLRGCQLYTPLSVSVMRSARSMKIDADFDDRLQSSIYILDCNQHIWIRIQISYPYPFRVDSDVLQGVRAPVLLKGRVLKGRELVCGCVRASAVCVHVRLPIFVWHLVLCINIII
jgi:hypothetical protein